MQIINDDLLDTVICEAKINGRLRKNFNFHKDLNDPMNRMLNALEPGTYLRPHRHLETGKTGVFIVLKGRLKIVFFDDFGNILRSIILSHDSGQYGIEISPNEWYTVVSLEKCTVIYEIKQGPFVPLTDNAFAYWSPLPNDKEAVEKFLKRLI